MKTKKKLRRFWKGEKNTLWVNTGYVNANYEKEIEVDDNTTDEMLDQIAKDYLFDYIEYGLSENK